MSTEPVQNPSEPVSPKRPAARGGLSAWVDRVALGAHHLGGVVLAAMMLLTALDVIGRFAFNTPIKGSQELAEVMLVLTVFFGVAYTALQKEHVRVELLLMFLNRKTQLLLNLFASLVSFVLVLGIAVQGIEQMIIQRQRFITTMLLEIPQWPFALLLSLGAMLLCLVLFKDIVHDFRLLKAEPWQPRHWLLVAVIAVAVTGLFVWGFAAKENVDPTTVGVVGMVLMLIVMFMGVPIGFCMSLVGTAGMMYLIEPATGLTLLQTTPFDTTCNYSLTVVPLFILMGAITFHSGIGKDLYMLAYRWFGHLPGGLSIATIGACGGFAAVSGSSLATAATMGMVALPEMKRYHYSNALATGCLAAGGTLGILIPPSVVLIIYGFLTTTSIATLFMAGFIPGVIQVILYMVTIFLICKINPEMGPRGSRSTLREKMLSLKDTWGVMFLFVLVIGGLYVGIFTPTEAGGVGAFGALVFIILRGRFNLRTMSASLKDSVKTTAMSFIVLMGAMFLGYFLTATQLPSVLSDVVSNLPYNRYIVLVMILVVYMLLGCVMDSLSIVLITVPIFFPVVAALGFDPIWFGIIMVRVVEIGMITPPVGINVFIIQGVAGDVPMHTIFKGVMPFLAADFVHVALLIIIPDMALFLPRLLGM
jgi:tripartite ATP-independent transporter DctM subunit